MMKLLKLSHSNKTFVFDFTRHIQANDANKSNNQPISSKKCCKEVKVGQIVRIYACHLYRRQVYLFRKTTMSLSIARLQISTHSLAAPHAISHRQD